MEGVMRRLACILAFFLLVASLAGCENGFGLAVLAADGSATDLFEDENVAIGLQMERGMVTLVTQRKSSREITLLWPQDSLILPDGSIYTLCYISGKYFNDGIYSYNQQYFTESGQDMVAVKRAPTAHVLNPYLFADTSPYKVEPHSIGGITIARKISVMMDLQKTEWPRLAAIRDPQDFTAPVRYPAGSDSFFFLEALAKRLKAGDKLTWVLEYRIEETGQVVGRTLTLMVTAR